MNDRAGSINSCLESDLFPSTPLTDEQMRQADKDFEGGVIPLNRIPEEDNSPEIDGIDPITDEGYIRAFMHNAAEQGRQSTFTTLSLQIHVTNIVEHIVAAHSLIFKSQRELRSYYHATL